MADIFIPVPQPDYSSFYSRIATALETIATNSTTIANQTTIIANQATTMANMLVDIEAHQQKLRELGEGPGIHVVGPYEWLSMYSIYKLLIEQGTSNWASIKAEIDALPKNF